MTETQQRFLQAIAQRVPPEHIVELHLFPSIRQGGVETGVAVVAASEPGTGDSELGASSGDGGVPGDGVGAGAPEQPDASTEPDSPPATVDTAEGAPDATPPSLDFPGPEVPLVDSAESPVPGPQALSRFTVHTAHYRLTLKGPDRGKWEVDVVAEADAPLEAVDAVVRGVQRRAGEAADPERLTGEAFRAALAEPAWMLAR